MNVYYNDNDPYCCAWLRNLIAAEHLPAGDVDERSIVDVRPDDLVGYTQAHFFAGIGGWPYALRLAGWPDTRPVWTGSCPCQPFSSAGKGKAADDERHLWPQWFSLIRKCRPATVFGEQVEAAIGWGWLDAVFADLEAEGYACGATVLPACSVGAPHIRQRLWFVAHARHDARCPEQGEQLQEHNRWLGQPGETGELADADATGCSEQRSGGIFDGERPTHRDDIDRRCTSGKLADSEHAERWPEYQKDGHAHGRDGPGRGDSGGVLVNSASEQMGLPGRARQPRSADSGMADTDAARCRQRRAREAGNGRDAPRIELTGLCVEDGMGNAEIDGSGPFDGQSRAGGESQEPFGGSSVFKFWSDTVWLPCTDGKQRPTQSGIFPLAHGLPARVAKLRAAGNAIVPQVAAEFIKAAM